MSVSWASKATLWEGLIDGEALPACVISGPNGSIPLAGFIHASVLLGRGEELRGRSVLIATEDQLSAALALIELDGIVRRVVVCPPDLRPEHLPFVAKLAAADAIVSQEKTSLNLEFFTCTTELVNTDYDRSSPSQTEWVLLTSGTTGPPKLVVHTLASLTDTIGPRTASAAPVVWSTFYDIRRYGGLQIFLRAVLTGASLVLSSSDESRGDFLTRASSHGITHISGTPSHWRRALMSPAAKEITPSYVRLSGEIADQAILNQLASFYPQAKIVHAFASTEAGVGFEVTDGLAGFPSSFLGARSGVEMKVEDGSIRIRSNRISQRYLGAEHLTDADGFVDTRDLVELRGDRYYFTGRRDGVINVGGLKVHPEEVEAVINRHPQVRMSLVRTRKNSITGALVVADVVLNAETGSKDHLRELQSDILRLCRETLSSHKVPATINFVPSLAVAETGKLIRNHA